MSEREKNAARAIADALHSMPDSKKEFLLGYAEGVAAMANPQQANRAQLS